MKQVITISRQYASGGRTIGKMVADKLGIPFNQFTMSLLFCVILFYIIFLVSAAALRFATVGAKVDER